MKDDKWVGKKRKEWRTDESGKKEKLSGGRQRKEERRKIENGESGWG